ncbi:MAG: hypothetical protein ACR2IY_06940 [Rubrivivax sp.]
MSCCNQNCGQGRECVAKVGQRYPRYPEPLRGAEQGYLRHLARWMLICICALFAAAFVMGVLHA